MIQSVRLLESAPVTHNVRRYRFEKPDGYRYEPGQATELSLDAEGWREKKSPFTFTGLPDAADLEFTIKTYFDHGGVTRRLWDLKPGDRVLLREPWGTITYKGPGTFIAGGAGVTPFIAILRHLARQGRLGAHRLIVSNKTEKDIILREEFEAMEGLDHDWVISNDRSSKLYRGRIDDDFLTHRVTDYAQHFYVCGPDRMVAELRELLQKHGAQPDGVTFEK
ncbi:MAG: FAD-binding oxidoreductase [Devosia sp.]|nr:FAD-binding oxidoreductase [Devosia sp.]